MTELQEQHCNLELFDWKKYLLVTAYLQLAGFCIPQTVLFLQKVQFSEVTFVLKSPPLAKRQTVIGQLNNTTAEIEINLWKSVRQKILIVTNSSKYIKCGMMSILLNLKTDLEYY